jgi:hypothetical protein
MQLSDIPRFLDDASYAFSSLRIIHDDQIGPGVFGRGAFRGSFSAGMTFNFTPGDAAVKSAAVSRDGLYRVYHDGSTQLSVTLDNGDANPRIDQVVLRVYDSFIDLSGFDKCEIEVVKGTPAASADLDANRGLSAANLATLTGAKSTLLLADVLVDASAVASSAAKIRDRRAYGWRGIYPPIFTDIDQVAVELPHTVYRGTFTIDGTGHNGRHTAMLCYVPRRIVGATRIRWGYRQNATTALTGNYVWSIFDASGRTIVSTATTAFTGAAGSTQRRADTITATTLERGYYWFLFAANGLNGAGSALCTGGSTDTGATGTDGRLAPFVNEVVQAQPNNLTIPTTILAYVDAATAQGQHLGVPVCSLSVG